SKAGLLPPSLRQLVRGLERARPQPPGNVHPEHLRAAPRRMLPSALCDVMTRSGHAAFSQLGWNQAWNRRRIESNATKTLVDRADPNAQEGQGSELRGRERRDDHLGVRCGREVVRRSEKP